VASTTKAPAGFQPPLGLLLGLGLATWMEFYTYDGVNLILPDMAGSLGVSQDQASWILTVYLSALLFNVPISIWMAAHVGYRRYIIASSIAFAVTSVGCAMAHDFATLLAWRILQGFAGAGLTMWWRASVYMLTVGPRRSASLMRISVMLYLATSAALLFCGYATDTVGWRIIFLPNIAFAALAVTLIARHYPDLPISPEIRTRSIDAYGILLLGAALVSLQIVLSRGDVDDWLGSSEIQLLFWIAALSLAMFIGWELSPRNTAPLLDLRLLRNRDLQAAVSLGLLAGIILSGSIYALPEFLRNAFPTPLSATQTGEVMCAYSLTAALIRPVVTISIGRFGQRKVITFAFAMLTLSMLTFSYIVTSLTPVILYTVPLALYALCLAPMLSALGGGTVSKLPNERQLDAVAIYMTFRQFGASLGVTLVTGLLNARETLHSSRLLEHVQQSAPAAESWLSITSKLAISRAGSSSAGAETMALKLLVDAANQQAQTLAYADTFLFMAGIGVVALCFVPIMSPSPVVKK
jgi:MFS transporter, DHA2 family, multidrug resistance protein